MNIIILNNIIIIFAELREFSLKITMGSCTSTLPIADVVKPEKTEPNVDQICQGIPPPDLNALGLSNTHPKLYPVIWKYVREHIRRDHECKMRVNINMITIRRDLNVLLDDGTYKDSMVDVVSISKQFKAAGWTVVSVNQYEVVVCFDDSSK